MQSLKRNSARLLTVLLLLTLMFGSQALAQKKSKDKAAAAQTQTTTTVDLNTATDKELNDLPGIGPATSKKIIDNRPYAAVDDLKKAGLSAKQIEKIRPSVTASGAPATTATAKPSAGKTKERASEETTQTASGPVDLNTATEKELNALPGVGPATSKKIIGNRPYASIDDLKKAGLSAKQIEKIRPNATASASSAAASPAAAPKSAATTASSSATAATQPAAPSPSRSEGRASGSGMPQRDAGTTTVPPAGSGMVWVNLDTRVYHREGDRWYGKTKNGKYMSKADAEAAGYRASKQK